MTDKKNENKQLSAINLKPISMDKTIADYKDVLDQISEEENKKRILLQESAEFATKYKLSISIAQDDIRKVVEAIQIKKVRELNKNDKDNLETFGFASHDIIKNVSESFIEKNLGKKALNFISKYAIMYTDPSEPIDEKATTEAKTQFKRLYTELHKINLNLARLESQKTKAKEYVDFASKLAEIAQVSKKNNEDKT